MMFFQIFVWIIFGCGVYYFYTSQQRNQKEALDKLVKEIYEKRKKSEKIREEIEWQGALERNRKIAHIQYDTHKLTRKQIERYKASGLLDEDLEVEGYAID
ncbi:MAG: hypothetical protein PHG07_09090 [Lachnospiraceae bacterium]|nr:hypothetical protein [Lachnospiraceae bacterium]